MTKRKTTATGLAKTSGQDGKLPGARSAGYTTLLADLSLREDRPRRFLRCAGKIVVCAGGVKPSHRGPQESFYL
jgi:hypothetical protein